MNLAVANRFFAIGIVAMLALAGHLHPALCQLAPGARGQAIGLPPASTITGTLHRAPGGSIVSEQPSVTSSPAAAPALPSVGAKKSVSKAVAARPSLDAGATPPTPEAESKPTSAPEPVAKSAPTPEPAAKSVRWVGSPDELDDVSCRTIAWQNPDYNQCRADLRAARARIASSRNEPAEAK